jgi:hypothetical protein
LQFGIEVGKAVNKVKAEGLQLTLVKFKSKLFLEILEVFIVGFPAKLVIY